MRWTRYALAGGMALGVILTACSDGANKTDKTGSEPKEVTAWWKTEGNNPSSTSRDGLTGAAKPGWTKLPPIDAHLAATGAKLFDANGCLSCHSIGKGKVVGPDLLGVTHRVEPDWLGKFIQDPAPFLESDPYAKELLATYLVKMPSLNLSAEQVRALVEFLRQEDAKASKGL